MNMAAEGGSIITFAVSIYLNPYLLNFSVDFCGFSDLPARTEA